MAKIHGTSSQLETKVQKSLTLQPSCRSGFDGLEIGNGDSS